ncbi:MAG: AAA family ATPase [Burkholderiaceae bacterium]|nr:AAA family ATPase [Burkholderiaceae bacterium]
MPRENFTPKVRELIAASAGHQCSFPTCNQRTSGPGHNTNFVSNSGYAAHIYSASKGGPRGQGKLTSAELKSPGNGIWLCGRHAKIVDNNGGVKYPPEVLLSYKALHEARVSLEHEGLYPPIGWLHELTIVQSPLFAAPQTFQFSKLNLIYGANSTGKTAIVEWINSLFDCTKLDRWMPAEHNPIKLRLSLLNPKLQNLEMTARNSEVKYSIDGKSVAFVPIGFAIFKPRRFDYSITDDAEMLAQALNVPAPAINSLIDEVNQFPHAKVQNLRLELNTNGDGNYIEQYTLITDVQGTAPGLPLRNLSGREKERILLEFSTAAARLSGKYCPTLLILDESVSVIFDGFFDFYSHHLLDPLNQFQTLMCIAEQDLDLNNVRWNGWQVIRTHGKPPHVSLNQDVRVK